MAKITRYQGNLKSFASESLGTERTIFGAETQSDALTDNITVNFLRGWGIVGVNENPTKQDFNGLAFTLGQLHAYLHQHGVAEWHVEQEYPEHAVCQQGGELYFSTIDANIGNAPGASPEWRLIPSDSRVNIATVTPATDADVTLTSAEYGANAIILVTGAWTVARNIIVPEEAREWQFFNDGAYAATVKTASGAGIVVQPGATTRLICDATNVMQELTMSGTSYSGTTSGLLATTGQGAVDEVMSNMALGVNDIINGKFQIAQTGTEFVSPASGAYDLDGWVRVGSGEQTVTITRVAGSVDGSYARESNVTTAKATLAAGDYEVSGTRLLGYDCVKYINQPFVVSFRAKSSLTGIHCVSIYNGTSSFVHEVNILAADTYQDVVIPVPMGTPVLNSSTNAIGFVVRVAQAVGTDRQTATTGEWVTGNFFGTPNQVNGLATVGNKLTIEDVRINLGTVPLPNVTGYDAELARCERYVELGRHWFTAARDAIITYETIQFKTKKNSSPMVNISDYVDVDSTGRTITSVEEITENEINRVNFDSGAGVDTGRFRFNWVAKAQL